MSYVLHMMGRGAIPTDLKPLGRLYLGDTYSELITELVTHFIKMTSKLILRGSSHQKNALIQN